MGKAKIAVTIDSRLLESVDRYVQEQKTESRSRFFEEAVAERVERYEKSRLARELEKIEPTRERALAEEGFFAENEKWPEY
ncbi:MAG: CopG family transcriptional regulator [Spirochaetia bacterium]|nr:CopG family transcriptional regulator [Spirochaetia bacterium]